MIIEYSRQYNVPPIAVAGAIADEYNTRVFPKSILDWSQDEVLLNWMPNCWIAFDAFMGVNSKLLNATQHDIGIGNIKLETAKKQYMLPTTNKVQAAWIALLQSLYLRESKELLQAKDAEFIISVTNSRKL